MKFKNCNVIYFKTQNIPTDIHSLRGKIIISDFPEVGRICNLYGILHILNQNEQKIPEGIDCVVCNSKNPELEMRINRNNMGIPVIYINMKQQWCGICGNLSPLDEKGPINKFCSPECMQKATGFTEKGVPESIKDLSNNIELFNFNRSDKSNKKKESSKSKEKIQRSVLREARRVEYAYKKENYKKEMRQPSHRKTKITSNKSASSEEEHILIQCKSLTKGGKERCKNKALSGNDYCGILSHQSQSQSQVTH